MVETAAAFYILTWFTSHGVKQHHSEVLLKRASIESDLSPNPKERGTGHCLFQWTGSRWIKLKRWSKSRGCPSLEKQLEFTMLELHTPEYSCFLRATAHKAQEVLTRTFIRGESCKKGTH